MSFDPSNFQRDARRDWQPPDNREIYDWARENVTLPAGGYAIPGRFDVARSRHVRDVFHDLKNPLIRQVNVLKATQSGGSMTADIWLAWVMRNDPGAFLWNFHDEPAAKRHAKTRVMPLLHASLSDLMPESRHDQTNSELYLRNGCPFYIQAGTIGRLQSMSIRYMVNDECWEWEGGNLREADARLDAYRKFEMEKVLYISQGGIEGTEWHRIAYDPQAEFHQWQVPCIHCGAFIVVKPEAEIDGKKVRLMTWDETGGNIHFECPKCNKTMEDSPRLKAHFNATGQYHCDNPLLMATKRTRQWNAFIWTAWSQLVKEYREALEAKKMGSLQPLQQFIQKKLAEFWREDDTTPIIQPATFDLEQTLSNGQGFRFLTIDTQKDHLWCLVREWQRDGTSRLLHWSKALSFSDAHEIAKRYGIPEGDYRSLVAWEKGGRNGAQPNTISGVLIDTGGDRTQDVYDACWRYGWIGLKGASDFRESFTHRNTIRGQATEHNELYDQTNTLLNYESRGSYLPLLIWATVGAKNILVNLRDGKGARWEVPHNIGLDYMRQINSEVKEQSGSKWKWTKLGSRANHAWDCEAMQVLAASMKGIFKL